MRTNRCQVLGAAFLGLVAGFSACGTPSDSEGEAATGSEVEPGDALSLLLDAAQNDDAGPSPLDVGEADTSDDAETVTPGVDDASDGGPTDLESESDASPDVGLDETEVSDIGDDTAEDSEAPECGPLGTGEDGDCLCLEGECFDPTSAACVDQWKVGAFEATGEHPLLLVPLRGDLISLYTDLGKLQAHVLDRIDATLAGDSLDAPLWAELGYVSLTPHFCSLFQLESSAWNPLHLEILWQQIGDGMSDLSHMPLTLAAIVTGKVDRCLLNHVLAGFRDELQALLDAWDEEMTEGLRAMLARYLMTSDFFEASPDEVLLEAAKSVLYPEGAVTSYGVWDSALIFDLVNGHFLELSVDETSLVASLDPSWQEYGGVDLVDCEGWDCPIKGVQQLVMLDALYGFVPEDKLVQMASLLLSNIHSDGALGFPAVMGLPPEILWDDVDCDIFCSSKHWQMIYAINHLVARLEHREDDIKAGAALLELDEGPGDDEGEEIALGGGCVSDGVAQCAPSAFCLTEGCGPGMAGVCTPRPVTCEQGGEPVCACDGNTYGNVCFAYQAGQRPIGAGACPAAAWECEVETGGSGFGVGCSLDEYCFGGCVGLGFCKTRATCGTEPVDMQCACNGLDYVTPCVLSSAGQNLAHEGSCGGEFENPTIEPCGGDFGLECEAEGEVCNLESCEPNAEGYCLTIAPPGGPQGWTEDGFFCVYGNPECGCDGVTYANQCERVSAGVALNHPGTCEVDGPG